MDATARYRERDARIRKAKDAKPTRSWRDRVRPGTGFAATDALNAASVVTTANPLTKEEAVVGREDLFV